MKAIVVDDEESARQTMTKMLERYCPEVSLLGDAESVSAAEELIESTNPDLIFLDIRIGKNSGFDLLQRIDYQKYSVIFTTAYDNYALQAIKFSAIDYLLKPLDPEALTAAVAKAQKQLDRNESYLRVLLEHLDKKGGQEKNIVLPFSGGYRISKIEEIIYLEADRNYSAIHFTDDTKLLVSKTLKQFDDLLIPKGFFRIHHSYLINLQHVKQFNSNGRLGYVEMKTGEKLEVARARKADLIAFFRSQITR